MKRVRSGIRVGVALAALVLWAQSATAGQLNLLPILTISGQFSDNVFFDEEQQEVSDTFFLVNPGIALDYASKNFVGSLGYQLGLQRYQDFENRDNNVHRIDATTGFSLGRGWFIDASDNLYITDDPLAFDASGDRIQRDSFTYNRFIPSVSYTFGSHDIRLAGRFDRVDIDYDNLIDSYQNAFGFNVGAKIGAKSTINFDYLEFDRHFQRQIPEVNVVDYRGRRYGARLDRRFTSRVSGNLFVGYEDRRFEINPERNDFESFIFEGTFHGEWPDVLSWTASVSQRLNDLAIRGAYKIQRFTYDVRKSIQERLRLEFGGYVQHGENRQIPEEVDFVGYRLEGQYLVAKFMNVWLGWEHIDRESDQLGPFDENRVNFGLTLSYGI